MGCQLAMSGMFKNTSLLNTIHLSGINKPTPWEEPQGVLQEQNVQREQDVQREQNVSQVPTNVLPPYHQEEHLPILC